MISVGSSVDLPWLRKGLVRLKIRSVNRNFLK